jgi:hypothetical protein
MVDLCSQLDRILILFNLPAMGVVALFKRTHTFKKQKIYYSAQFEKK